MSSILLDKSKFKKLDSVYNSNMENIMNNIEYKQANQNFNKPEYLNQFDQLTFDNTSEPSAINDIHKGASKILERNLDFQKDFSQFQESDMHYGVVDKYNFTHNNMIPSTSKRDFSNNTNSRHDRKLETFTGISDTYTKKTEKVPLFKPMSDLTWTNGMPAIASKLQNRYLPSNKNNMGDLPFENKIRVVPGLAGENQTGKYSVYRINPVNVDNLRSEINKKVTYENKPLETVKKGEVRGPDFNLTKFKVPDFRERKFSDLLPSKSLYDGPIQTGVFTNVASQRGENEFVQAGPAVNTNIGDIPNKNQSIYGDAKKESYTNDISHGITEVSNKPVMTNVKSFTNYETQRASTNSTYEGPITGIANYVKDYKDIPLTTLRELMINGNTNIGISGSQEKNGHIFSNDMILPVTNRQQYTTAEMVGAATSNVKIAPSYNNDNAKETIRQTTSHNIITNANPTEKTGITALEDVARATIRQQTEKTENIGSIKSNLTDSVYYKNNDVAKMTIRQQIEKTENIGSIKSNLSDSSYYKNNDIAKMTIRQQTENTGNIGSAKSNSIDSTYHKNNDIAKMTIRQQTENTGNIGSAKSNSIDGTYHKNNDIAKTTIRQQTENTGNIGSAKSNIIDSTYHKNNDIAKTTIRQQTENTENIGGIKSNMNDGTYYKDATDEARMTTKQTTLLKDYVGVTNGEINKPMSHMDANNMTISDCREISTYNRPANGKRDLNGPYIDRDNVKLNEPILFSYVSHPHKTLDFSVTPTVAEETIKQVYKDSRPIVDFSSYYVNPNFINTLKNNPLVNDIYHQKNYK